MRRPFAAKREPDASGSAVRKERRKRESGRVGRSLSFVFCAGGAEAFGRNAVFLPESFNKIAETLEPRFKADFGDPLIVRFQEVLGFAQAVADEIVDGRAVQEPAEQIAAGALFFLAAAAVPSVLMRIFTSEVPLIEAGVPYLRAVAPSYLFCGVSQIYLCIMKNSGHAKMSMIVSSSSVVINIVLNAVFIFGLLGIPALHAAGAAVATVIARFIEMLWAVLHSLKQGRCKFRLRFFTRTDQVLRGDCWKYTLPVLGNELVWGVGFTMYTVIMGHLGNDATAANSVANIVKNLIACFCLGLGSGGSIMVGNELGAGDLPKEKEYGDQLCKLSVIGGIISGAVLICFAPLVLLLTKYTYLTQTAGEYLRWMLLICSVYMLGKSVNATIVGGIFCAGGDTRFGLVCDFITMWCVVVPAGFIAAFVFDLPVIVVYLIVSLDEFIKIPFVVWRYKKYKWVKDLTQHIEQNKKEIIQ